LPQYLILALNRFRYSGGKLAKVMSSVNVQNRITANGEDFILASAVIHAGQSAGYGHYYALRCETEEATDMVDSGEPVLENQSITLFNDSTVSHQTYK